MLRLKRSDVILPSPGTYRDVRRSVISRVRAGTETLFLLRGNGSVERYFGTSHNKQGWSVITYQARLWTFEA